MGSTSRRNELGSPFTSIAMGYSIRWPWRARLASQGNARVSKLWARSVYVSVATRVWCGNPRPFLGHSRYGDAKVAPVCSLRQAEQGIEATVAHRGGGVDRVAMR